MSAAEIIEQFKSLPSEQREEVANFIRQFSGNVVAEENGTSSREARFQKAADKVFTEHRDLLHRLAQ